jgi:hypothetical protein
MNFGTLKDIFTEKLIESYVSETSNGKELYKKFLKTIKESETLKTAFIVFKNIETKTIKNEVSAVEYVKESISLFDNFRGKKSLVTEMEKLTRLLESNGVDFTNKETKKIHRDLQNLITASKNVYTLQKLQESKEGLVSWLVSDKEVINESEEKSFVRKNIDPKRFLEIAVEKYNEKYKESLTEEEKNILKVLRENNEDKTKTLVSDLIKENISLVNQHLELYNDSVTVKSKLLETKDTIYKMMENNDSFKEKVLRLYELKKSLKNDQ